jgi:hypothetical protein
MTPPIPTATRQLNLLRKASICHLNLPVPTTSTSVDVRASVSNSGFTRHLNLPPCRGAAPAILYGATCNDRDPLPKPTEKRLSSLAANRARVPPPKPTASMSNTSGNSSISVSNSGFTRHLNLPLCRGAARAIQYDATCNGRDPPSNLPERALFLGSQPRASVATYTYRSPPGLLANYGASRHLYLLGSGFYSR